MSRYLILVLLNVPLIAAGILTAITNYKTGRFSKNKFLYQLTLWLVLLAGLALVKPIYQFLFSNNLTETEPLSLFDVVEITAIVLLFFVNSRQRSKLDVLEQRLRDLHQELSITLSDKDTKKH